MKWILILILVSSVALLGCSPNNKNEQDPEQKTAEGVSFDDAMGSDFDTSKWITNYDESLKLAKSLNRPVLVNFTGSDWCSWCIKLSKEVFTEEVFLKYAKENLVLLKLDFPKSIAQTPEEKAANDKLSKQFKITGFPTIILLSPEGTELARTGYQPGGANAYVAHLKSLLAAKE
ncbi:MAG: thioredoxin [Candidatus Cloacimonetes bacterium HGW-Cloacimonetes-3]|jgi:thioredoxin-related protein|nr:MAG: thioredoxin [Candidatus Cloacimonetes bacterium HGW-Cloacimonetes-3]